MFQHFVEPMRFYGNILIDKEVAMVHITDEEYQQRPWSKKRRINEFINTHSIDCDNKILLLPIVRISSSELELITGGSAVGGFSNEGMLHTSILGIWLIVINNCNPVFRESIYFTDQKLLDDFENYSFRFEQHHWDSVVQMGFKEYISRMK